LAAIVVNRVVRQQPVLDLDGRGDDLDEELVPRFFGTQVITPSAVSSSTRVDAGTSLLARRAQNRAGLRRPVLSISARRWDVMRKPLMAKKTSTPT